jgi:uncharacterized protein (DUF488 family)
VAASAAADPPEILTVGHSTHPIERFVALLDGADVRAIADVRRFPGSRRNPQFGADSLRSTLSKADIAYEPFAERLGGRRRSNAIGESSGLARPDNSAWRNASFRAYADYMAEETFEAGLARLKALALSRRTAVMCAEAHPSRCHRQLIADALFACGWRVLHLLADGRLEAHAPAAHALITDGRVSYPGAPSLDV